MNPTFGHDLIPGEKHFRWRAGEITRMEAFTDAVFAFAVTLLVVSLEVPKTYSELMEAMRGFAAFAVCFAVLIQVWVYHYIFSRRYGLQTFYTLFLNSVLLFVVLFFVYPLKFMFSLMLGVNQAKHAEEVLQITQVPTLMLVYSAGFAAVFGVFALLYGYAYRNRQYLELNEYETLRTRHAVIDHSAMALFGISIGLLAMIVPVRYSGPTGLLYFLIGIYHTISGMIFGKREQLALERTQVKESAAAGS